MINYEYLNWVGDYDGEDLGMSDLSVISIYTFKDMPFISVYIDILKEQIITIYVED